MKQTIKSHYSIFLILISILISCSRFSKDEIIIEGEVMGLSSNKVRVFEVLPNEIDLIDSASIINGKFKIKIKQASVSFYIIQFSENKKLDIIAKGGDNIMVKGSFLKGIDSFEVKGSAENDVYTLMNSKLRKCYAVTNSLSKVLTNSMYEADCDYIKNSIDSSYNSLISNHRQFLENIIKNHSNSLISVMAFYESLGNKKFFDNYQDFEWLKLIYKGLNSSLKGNIHVEAFNLKYEKIKSEIETAQKTKASLMQGMPAPIMTFFTEDKGVVSTSSFKGKNLLIFFWGFMSQASIDQFSNVSKFTKNNKIELLAVSLNPNSEDAIQFSRKKLPSAISVNEDKMLESQSAKIYDVKLVPCFFLINSEGKIVTHSSNFDSIVMCYKEIQK